MKNIMPMTNAPRSSPAAAPPAHMGTDSIPCLGLLWYTQKRSKATTPAILFATLYHYTYAHHSKRSTHHGHPPPQRTSRSPASNQRPKNWQAKCLLFARSYD